jgi:hypothetical protein
MLIMATDEVFVYLSKSLAGKVSMHGLMGERLLKRFLKGIRRKPQITPVNETEPVPESRTRTTDGVNCQEIDPPQGKEVEQNIVKRNNPKNAPDMRSGATQSPDEIQKTK